MTLLGTRRLNASSGDCISASVSNFVGMEFVSFSELTKYLASYRDERIKIKCEDVILLD